MHYYQSELYKAKKSLLLTEALAAYHEAMHEDHEDLDILEDLMADHGFFSGDSDSLTSKPSLSIIQGQGIKPKRSKKSRVKLVK